MTIEPSHEVKVAFVGESGVGKTTIIQSFEKSDVPDQPPTLGACFSMHVLKIDGETIRLKIWDTAGQEKFKSLAPMYYRDAQTIVLVFSVTEPDSFEATRLWFSQLREEFAVIPKLFLIANKIDLPRKVDELKSRAFAEEINAVYYETSAKTHVGIQELLTLLGSEATAIVQENYHNVRMDDAISSFEEKKEKSKCCL